MTNEELSAHTSKCWTCKHGMCLMETQRQMAIHEGMSTPDDDAELDAFEFLESQESTQDPLVHQVSVTRAGAICYWGAQMIDKQQPPIRVEHVSECSRFEKQ